MKLISFTSFQNDLREFKLVPVDNKYINAYIGYNRFIHKQHTSIDSFQENDHTLKLAKVSILAFIVIVQSRYITKFEM